MAIVRGMDCGRVHRWVRHSQKSMIVPASFSTFWEADKEGTKSDHMVMGCLTAGHKCEQVAKDLDDDHVWWYWDNWNSVDWS